MVGGFQGRSCETLDLEILKQKQGIGSWKWNIVSTLLKYSFFKSFWKLLNHEFWLCSQSGTWANSKTLLEFFAWRVGPSYYFDTFKRWFKLYVESSLWRGNLMPKYNIKLCFWHGFTDWNKRFMQFRLCESLQWFVAMKGKSDAKIPYKLMFLAWIYRLI